MPHATDMTSVDAVVATLFRAADILREHPRRAGSHIMLPAHGTLLATGDLHDHPTHYATIVRLARLEANLDRHVILQELIHSERLINGVDLSYRMLVRVADLVIAHPAQVHPILGNHELAQLTGRPVSKGAGNNVALFDDGLQYVFNDASLDVAEACNEFIRAMPLAVRSESGVFCAHSLPAPGTFEKFNLTILDRELVDADYLPGTGSAYLMVWGRGHSEEQLRTLAEVWSVSVFILGHEFVETGCEMRAANMIRLNSDHDGGAVVPIDLSDPPTAEQAVLSALRLNALGGCA